MKNEYWIAFIVMLCALCAQAQRDTLQNAKKETLTISLLAGTSFPSEKFASAAYPPRNGVAYQTEVAYRVSKIFGLFCSYTKTINETAIPSEPVTSINYYGGMGNPYKYNTYVYWSGAWQTDNLCLGLMFQAQDERVKLRGKLAGGIQNVKTPTVNIYYLGSNTSQEIMGTTEQLFVFNAGLDVHVKLIYPLFITGGIDLYDSAIGFHGAQEKIILLTTCVGLSYVIR